MGPTSNKFWKALFIVILSLHVDSGAFIIYSDRIITILMIQNMAHLLELL